MKKSIWIINHYASNMFEEKGGRHYSFAKYLNRTGYKTTIFCANSRHGKGTLFFDLNNERAQTHVDKSINTPFVFIKARAYRNNGIRRIMNMIDFYKNVLIVARQYENKNQRPEVIIGSSVHPLSCIAAIHLSKKYKSKCIIEIRDLWPESIVVYGIARKNNPIVKLLYKLEQWIYEKADEIIFTMAGGKDYIIEKGWNKESGGPIDVTKVHHINNGVDLEVFDYNKEHFIIEDEDLNNEELFKVVYAGSIRRVNNLGQLVEVAKQLQKIGEKSIKFLIYGDGDEREKLSEECTNSNLTNIVFKGKIEKCQIPYVLSKADLCVLHWQPTPITKYGVSMNKFFEYFAAGKPILSNSAVGYDLIQKYKCGVAISIKNDCEYVNTILGIKNLEKKEKELFCVNSRKAAEAYDFKELTKSLIELLE